MLFKEGSSNDEVRYRSIPFENPSQDVFSDLRSLEIDDFASESRWYLQYQGFSMSTENLSEDEEIGCITHSCVKSDGPSTSCLSMADGASEMHRSEGVVTNQVLLNAPKEKCLEAEVLQELKDIIMKLTPKERICFRDSFYLLAQNSMRNRKESTKSCMKKRSTISNDGKSMSFARSMLAESTDVDKAILSLMFDGKNCSLSDLLPLGMTHQRRRSSTNTELNGRSLRRPSKLARSNLPLASGKNVNFCQL